MLQQPTPAAASRPGLRVAARAAAAAPGLRGSPASTSPAPQCKKAALACAGALAGAGCGARGRRQHGAATARRALRRKLGALSLIEEVDLTKEELAFGSNMRPENELWWSLADKVLRLSPVLIFAFGVVAFQVFPEVADSFADFAFARFDVSRGRPIADQVLTSIVVPGLGILFATLSSSTLSVLRGRQQEMRKSLRQEAILLDSLAKPVRRLFTGKEELLQALTLLERYATWVVIETDANDAEEKDRIFTAQRVLTSKFLDLLGTVDEELLEGDNPTRAIILGRVVGYAQSLVNKLDQLRASRRAATCFTFPLLHWAILLFLALSLPTAALILAATLRDTSPVVYSDWLVRTLIATITGAPLLLLSLLADLNEPYAGFVQLTQEPIAFEEAARRLSSQRKALEESMAGKPA